MSCGGRQEAEVEAALTHRRAETNSMESCACHRSALPLPSPAARFSATQQRVSPPPSALLTCPLKNQAGWTGSGLSVDSTVVDHQSLPCLLSVCLSLVHFINMHAFYLFALVGFFILNITFAFMQTRHCGSCIKRFCMSSIDDSSQLESISIPKSLPSAKGIDYVPLATMLASGDFLGADQFTRDNLIVISGAAAAGRSFVYWTEVKNIPSIDLATMERLWLQFSNGKFGYSIQKRIWDAENGNFDTFIQRIGWTKKENGSERLLRWFGSNEFIYDLEKAPKGHLPLTAALRGTQLLKQLMEHPVWNMYDWKNYENLKWD
jgi:hypothetical protein